MFARRFYLCEKIMINQGVWILAFMLYTAPHEIVLVPYELFPSYQLCATMKDIESRRFGKTMICTQEKSA
jgi:hypothetical protein